MYIAYSIYVSYQSKSSGQTCLMAHPLCLSNYPLKAKETLRKLFRWKGSIIIISNYTLFLQHSDQSGYVRVLASLEPFHIQKLHVEGHTKTWHTVVELLCSCQKRKHAPEWRCLSEKSNFFQLKFINRNVPDHFIPLAESRAWQEQVAFELFGKWRVNRTGNEEKWACIQFSLLCIS